MVLTVVLLVVLLISSLLASQWFSSNTSSDLINDGYVDQEEPKIPSNNSTQYSSPDGSNIFGTIKNTDLRLNGVIDIGGDLFTFDPHQIVTKRPDIFQPGHFSVFDILPYLKETGMVAVEYHFDEELNTHVVDSINDKQNWWYQAYYDGGWIESNVFRMDHYPVKDKMYIKLFQTSPERKREIYSSFESQIDRREQSENMTILEVVINGKYKTWIFKNVVVEAHSLRTDVFKPGVITAVDIILSLAEQAKISYGLRWYATIGNSEIKSFYVDRINEDKVDVSSDPVSCGFVYECGERKFGWSNHIHLPSDIRVINSPEYMKWFWICI